MICSENYRYKSENTGIIVPVCNFLSECCNGMDGRIQERSGAATSCGVLGSGKTQPENAPCTVRGKKCCALKKHRQDLIITGLRGSGQNHCPAIWRKVRHEQDPE